MGTNNPEVAEVRTRGKNKTVYIVVAVVATVIIAAVIAIAVVFTREEDKAVIVSVAATSVAPTIQVQIAQRFTSEIKLNANWSAEYGNSSSAEYQKLAKDVKEALLPALKNENPSIDTIEILEFKQGSIRVLFEIVMNVSAPHVNTTQLQLALTSVISTVNITGVNVERNYIPTIQRITTTVSPTTTDGSQTTPARNTTTPEPPKQRFTAKMKLTQNWTDDLTRPNTQVFKDLAQNVKGSLLPILKKENPHISEIEVTGFEQGSVIAIYDIIMAVSAPKVNLSELHSSLSNVIKTANFTNLPVDKTYVPPMITEVTIPKADTTTNKPTNAPTTTSLQPTHGHTNAAKEAIQQKFKSALMIQNKNWTSDLNDSTSSNFKSFASKIEEGIFPALQKANLSIASFQVVEFTWNTTGYTAHYMLMMDVGVSANITLLQAAVTQAINDFNSTLVDFDVDKSNIHPLEEIPPPTSSPTTTSQAQTGSAMNASTTISTNVTVNTSTTNTVTTDAPTTTVKSGG